MEMAIGKYPIPPPSPEEISSIFGPNALEEHMQAAKTGKPLKGRPKNSTTHAPWLKCNITVSWFMVSLVPFMKFLVKKVIVFEERVCDADVISHYLPVSMSELWKL